MKLLLGIEITTLFLGIKSFGNKNNTLDDIKLLDNKSNNLFAIMVKDSSGNYNESSTFPTGAYILNETMSSCVDNNGNKIDNVLSYENGHVLAKTTKTVYCYLYFDKENTVYSKVLDDYENNNGVQKTTDENGKDVYYYTGDITNNNILFNNYCWKMVRTTETDGVKLIYNGELRKVIGNDPIIKDKYNITTNTPTGTPFTFDESTKKWTSGIAGINNGNNTIEFTVTEAGNYVLNYEVSSAIDDVGSFYRNGIELKANLDGVLSGQIELNNLTLNDVIKVVYKKDVVYNDYDDVVRFSIGKITGSVTTNCYNTGSDLYLESKKFQYNKGSSQNSYLSQSPAYVGYMYGDPHEFSIYEYEKLGTYYYGSDVTWNGTTYTLIDAESGTIEDMYDKLNNKHYTCLSTGNNCTKAYYIHLVESEIEYVYVMDLVDGKKIEDVLDEMLNHNTNNSIVKTVIDNWFSTNMINVTNYLENTIYCNNRNISNLGGWNPSGGDISGEDGYLKFNDYSSSNARLTCQDKEDQFTLKVDSGGIQGYGNNALAYPVGLLTAKEANFARNGSNTNYLNNGNSYWLLSPNYFSNNYAYVRNVNYGSLDYYDVGNSYGAQPAVSLSKKVKLSGEGNGTVESPYILAPL